MKKFRPSVWLTVLMVIYATAFFAYKFFVENVGVSVRNITVVVITYLLVVAVWFLNRLYERRQKAKAEEENKKNTKDKEL